MDVRARLLERAAAVRIDRWVDGCVDRLVDGCIDGSVDYPINRAESKHGKDSSSCILIADLHKVATHALKGQGVYLCCERHNQRTTFPIHSTHAGRINLAFYQAQHPSTDHW